MNAGVAVSAADAPLPFSSILMTGADGFVGRVLLRRLLARVHADTRVMLCSRGPAAPQGRVARIAMDITDDADVARAIDEARPDLVIHLAALSSVAQSVDAAAETWRVNLGGSLALASRMAQATPEATMLFVSSAEVYGTSFNDGPVDEGARLRPQSPYARSKAAAEAMLGDVLTRGNRLIVARPSNHSGPGQDARFVLPAFAEQIARIETGLQPPAVRVGNLSPERDFLDVRDVADAYLALLDAAPRLPDRSIFNVGSGEPVTIAAMLDMMIARTGLAIAIEQDPARMRSSDVPRTLLDVRRIGAATSWRPRHRLETLLGDLVDAGRAALAGEAGAVLP